MVHGIKQYMRIVLYLNSGIRYLHVNLAALFFFNEIIEHSNPRAYAASDH